MRSPALLCPADSGRVARIIPSRWESLREYCLPPTVRGPPARRYIRPCLGWRRMRPGIYRHGITRIWFLGRPTGQNQGCEPMMMVEVARWDRVMPSRRAIVGTAESYATGVRQYNIAHRGINSWRSRMITREQSIYRLGANIGIGARHERHRSQAYMGRCRRMRRKPGRMVHQGHTPDTGRQRSGDDISPPLRDMRGAPGEHELPDD